MGPKRESNDVMLKTYTKRLTRDSRSNINKQVPPDIRLVTTLTTRLLAEGFCNFCSSRCSWSRSQVKAPQINDSDFPVPTKSSQSSLIKQVKHVGNIRNPAHTARTEVFFYWADNSGSASFSCVLNTLCCNRVVSFHSKNFD